MNQASFGSIIRSLRRQQSMTQAELANQVGVTDKAVSKWERGVSYPDISLFPKLADVLGVTVDDLLQEFTEEERPSRLLQIFQMSHDIRTPLHIILGCADMALKYHEDKDRLLRYLENIHISGEYLLQTIDQIMEVASQERPGEIRELREFLYQSASDTPFDYDFSGKCILLAEDMALNREIAYELLRSTGASIDFAEDGAVAVEKISHSASGTYDLILMDIRMPDMDGIEATRQIRALEDAQKASIPIIAMTANVYEKDRNAAFAAGMNGFTEKPIVREKLFSMMQQFL